MVSRTFTSTDAMAQELDDWHKFYLSWNLNVLADIKTMFFKNSSGNEYTSFCTYFELSLPLLTFQSFMGQLITTETFENCHHILRVNVLCPLLSHLFFFFYVRYISETVNYRFTSL